MRVGMIGTGAISHKHAEAYHNIGYQLTVCTDINPEAGRRFAAQYGAEFVASYQEVCRHPNVDYVDVCTFPDFRMQALEVCAQAGKHVQVQKPIATTIETARAMVDDRPRRRHLPGRGQPASLRRLQPVPAPRHRRRTPRQTAPMRLLRQVVSLAGILCAAHQGQLADRGRRRAHQPGHSPGRYPALAGRSACAICTPSGNWARCTRSNPKTW